MVTNQWLTNGCIGCFLTINKLYLVCKELYVTADLYSHVSTCIDSEYKHLYIYLHYICLSTFTRLEYTFLFCDASISRYLSVKQGRLELHPSALPEARNWSISDCGGQLNSSGSHVAVPKLRVCEEFGKLHSCGPCTEDVWFLWKCSWNGTI